MYKLSPIVKKILLINVCVYFLNNLLNLDFIGTFGLRDLHSSHFRAYQILTHLFIHANFSHLFSNMITLCTFGPILENTLSSKKFLGLYITTGIGASLLYLLYLYFGNPCLNFYNEYVNNPNPEMFSAFLQQNYETLYNNYFGFIYDFLHDSTNPIYIDKSISILKHLCNLKFDVPIVGASGAIFGLLASFAILYPKAKLCLLLIPIPIEARYFVIFYGMYELIAGLQANPGDNVAHLAHLAGIFIAYLYLKIFNKKRFY